MKYINTCDLYKRTYHELVGRLSEYGYSPAIGFEYDSENFDNIINVYHELYQLVDDIIDYDNDMWDIEQDYYMERMED